MLDVLDFKNSNGIKFRYTELYEMVFMVPPLNNFDLTVSMHLISLYLKNVIIMKSNVRPKSEFKNEVIRKQLRIQLQLLIKILFNVQ